MDPIASPDTVARKGCAVLVPADPTPSEATMRMKSELIALAALTIVLPTAAAASRSSGGLRASRTIKLAVTFPDLQLDQAERPEDRSVCARGWQLVASG